MDLKLELQTLWKNNLSVEDYSLKSKAVADILPGIEEVFERDLILYGVGGLDSEYNSFVSTTIMLMRSEHVTWAFSKSIDVLWS